MLVSDGHAAAALAQAVGRAVGYDTTALLFIDRDTATLSVVQTHDGSVVKVLSRTLHSDDAMGVLTEMAAAVDAQEAPPQGMFVVGSGVDVTSVRAHLEHLVSIPVNAPEEPELALARGAAPGSSQRPGVRGVHRRPGLLPGPRRHHRRQRLRRTCRRRDAAARRSAAWIRSSTTSREPTWSPPIDAERKPFLLVGSALTSIFVVGVVALVISLAVSIRPTADQRPSPGQSAIVPSVSRTAPAPAPGAGGAPVVAPPPPPPETIKAPVPVVQQAPAGTAAHRLRRRRLRPPRRRTAAAAPPRRPRPLRFPSAPAPVPYIPAPVYNPPIYNPYPPPVYYLRPRPWKPPWRPPWHAAATAAADPQEPQHRKNRNSRRRSRRCPRRRRGGRLGGPVVRLGWLRWYPGSGDPVAPVTTRARRLRWLVRPRRFRWLLPDLLRRWLVTSRPHSLPAVGLPAQCRLAVSSSRLHIEAVCDAPSSVPAISARPMPPEWPSLVTT